MQKNYINNLHNNGTVNINHEAPHIVPKVLTQQVGLANDIDFVGRKEELKKVDELLNENSMLLLLNGIGGIGKSTLASYYLNHNKDKYNYYGFVQVNEDIKLSLASAFGTSLNLQSEKIDDLFAEIMNKLQNLEGEKLLIIDDVKEMDNQLDEMNTLMTLKNSGFKILFTSREVKEYIPQYVLDIMNVVDARELFLKHFPTDEIEKVDKILEYVDYHTLFIEITAKTLKKRKNTLSLDIAIEKFENGEFSVVQRNKSESFNKFLKNFSYDSTILTQKKTLLFLKRLSILPSIEISFDDLYKFLVCEDKEQLEDFLIELVDNGWLIESQHHYKFHQILKEFVFDSYVPEFEEIKEVVKFFNDLIDNSADAQIAVNIKSRLIYFGEIGKVLGKFGNDNEQTTLFYNDLGNIYFHLGQYNKALPLYQQALIIREKILGKNHLSTSTSYNNLAELYKKMGEYQKALPFSKKALTILEEQLGESHSSTATNYNNLAELYKIIGEYRNALILYKKALKIDQKNLGENHQNTSDSYNSLAEFYRETYEYEKALPLYKKALTIRKEKLGRDHPSTATIYNNLALYYHLIGEYEKALPLHEKALTIRKEKLGNNHPDVAQSYNNLAGLYESMLNYQKALLLYEKALTIRKEQLGNNHPDVAQSYHNLGRLYDSIGEYKKALLFYKNALAIREKKFGENHIVTADTYNDLATLYYLLREYEKALPLCQKALAVREEQLSSKHPNIAISHNNLAEIYSSMGEYQKALQLYQNILSLHQKKLGKNHPTIAQNYNNQAEIYRVMGQYNKALSFHNQALDICLKVLGEKHPSTAICYNNIASLYNAIKEYTKALPFYEKALQIQKEMLGENHFDTGISYNNLAIFSYEQGEYYKAYKYMKKTVHILEVALPDNHPDLLNAKEDLKAMMNKLKYDIDYHEDDIQYTPINNISYKK